MMPFVPMPVTRQIYRRSTGPLWRRLVRWQRGPVICEIVEPYTYDTTIDGRPVQLFLPPGFRSDLASSPRLSWLVGFRPDGVMALPAWFHDFLLSPWIFFGFFCLHCGLPWPRQGVCR